MDDGQRVKERTIKKKEDFTGGLTAPRKAPFCYCQKEGQNSF